MASQKLKDLMNKGLASEIQATIQYMWQHVQWIGVEHYAVSEQFKEIAIQEMKHAEKIAPSVSGIWKAFPPPSPPPFRLAARCGRWWTTISLPNSRPSTSTKR